jgi:hypothetical protein
MPYSAAVQRRLVRDNLNAHAGASLYEAEARRLLDEIEFPYTPKHGRWRNRAETAISTMNQQCLDRRPDSQDTWAAEGAAWERERNARQARIPWTFPLAAARQQLRKSYPSNEAGRPTRLRGPVR